jgi:hypothetical protein
MPILAALAAIAEVAVAVAAIVAVAKQIREVAEEIAKVAMYGPQYIALQAAKATTEYFENSDILKTFNIKLGSEYMVPFGSTKYWDSIQKSINSANVKLGIGGNLSANIRDNAMKSREEFIGLGLEADNFLNSYSTFASTYNRTFLPDQGEMKEMATINKIYGGAYDQLYPLSKLYGKSITDTTQFMNKMVVEADKYGITSNKIFADMQKNIGMLDKYNFKTGYDGLKKMVVETSKLNMNMSSVAGFAEKLYEPEDAIEMAASLQMLGGEFSQFGDVFQLMYDANNDVGALTEKIAKLTNGMGTLNKKTGEIDFTSFERNQLRSFAKMSNIPIEEMIQTRRVTKREEMVKKYISPELKKGSMEDVEARINKLAMLAEFKGGVPKVKVAGGEKDISQVTLADLSDLSTVGRDELKTPLENLLLVNMSQLDKLKIIADKITLQTNSIASLRQEEASMGVYGDKLEKMRKDEDSLLGFTLDSIDDLKAGVAAETIAEEGWFTRFRRIMREIHTESSYGYEYYKPQPSSIDKQRVAQELQKNNESSFRDKAVLSPILQTDVEARKALLTTLERRSILGIESSNSSHIIEFKYNGVTYNAYDAVKDPKFKEYVIQQLGSTKANEFLSTLANGGKNTGPLPNQ